MKKILLALALVLVMAIPAMSAVVPQPMNIVVYQPQDVVEYRCPYTMNSGYCQHYECITWFIVCLDYGWVGKPMTSELVWTDEIEVTQVPFGETRMVKGTIFSEVEKNTKYRLLVKVGTTVTAKTPWVDQTPLTGHLEIQFPDYTFDVSGLHVFSLQIMKPGGTIISTATRVFVPTPPGAEPAFKEEPALEEFTEE